MTIVTRTGFCQTCYNAGRPRLEDAFLVYGSSGNKLKVIRAEHYGKRGYVPTLYRLCKVIDDKAYYQTFCSHCGSYWSEEEKDGKTARFLCMDEEKWSGWIKTSLSNWNALVVYKHDETFWI